MRNSWSDGTSYTSAEREAFKQAWAEERRQVKREVIVKSRVIWGSTVGKKVVVTPLIDELSQLINKL